MRNDRGIEREAFSFLDCLHFFGAEYLNKLRTRGVDSETKKETLVFGRSNKANTQKFINLSRINDGCLGHLVRLPRNYPGVSCVEPR